MDNARKSGGWDTVIRPRTGWFDIDFKGLVRYRDLILLMVKRNFTVLYKQTILGPAWVVIQPLLTTLVFTVVFGNLAGLPRTACRSSCSTWPETSCGTSSPSA